MDSTLDSPMYFINQAAFSYWHSQTKMRPKWETMITLLYEVVHNSLGLQTHELLVFSQMQVQYFPKAKSINENLLS